MKNPNILLTLFAMPLMMSCGNAKVNTAIVSEKTTDTSIDVIERDTVFTIPSESSTMLAKLVTNSLGEISIEHFTVNNTSESMADPVVRIVDNYLHVDCEKKAQELFAQWKENHKHTTTHEVKTSYVQVERSFSTFEIISIWTGRVAMLMLLIAIIMIVMKVKNPFKK